MPAERSATPRMSVSLYRRTARLPHYPRVLSGAGGGIATFTEEIAKATASLGYEIEVWAQSAQPHHERPWPFRLRRLPLKGTHDLWCQIQLAREFIRARRRLRYATVYLPEPGPMLTMMLLQFFRAFRPSAFGSHLSRLGDPTSLPKAPSAAGSPAASSATPAGSARLPTTPKNSSSPTFPRPPTRSS